MYVKKLNENMDVLEFLFLARDNKLIEITQADKEETKDINSKIQQKDKELKDLLDNLKDNFITQKVLEIFYEYADLLLDRGAYYNKKYYKEGFKDALGLIIHNINKIC